MAAAPRRVARLGGEPGAEFGRRILARHHEQVVKSNHRGAQGQTRQPLIQPVKDAAPRGPNGRPADAAACSAAPPSPPPEKNGAAAASIRSALLDAAPPAQQDLARIQSHPAKFLPDGVSGVERDSQLSLYSFIFRYRVVRPMPSNRAVLPRSPWARPRRARWRSFRSH